MGLIYYVDLAGNVVNVGNSSATGVFYGAAFDTNVLTARLYMSGDTITATGTDVDVDINLVAKNSGYVTINRINASAGFLDGTVIGSITPAAGTFTTIDATTATIASMVSSSYAFLDLDSSNTLTLAWAENDVADRSINLNVNAGDRTINIFGNTTLDQDVDTTSSPEFAGLTLTGFDGVISAAAGVLSAAPVDLDDIPDGAVYGRVLNTSLNGNEVVKLTDAAGDDMTVSLDGANRILFLGDDSYLNQDLRTTATPSFAGLNLPKLILAGAFLGEDSLTMTIGEGIADRTYAGAGGAGDNALLRGVYTGAATTDYEIDVVSGDPASPNTFRWRYDNGGGWSAWDDNGGLGYDIPGSEIALPVFVPGDPLNPGVDDLTIHATADYTGAAFKDYMIRIMVGGGDPTNPNTFEFSDDSGATWDDNGGAGYAITGAAQAIGAEGVVVIWGAVTGHEDSDTWAIEVRPYTYYTLIDGIEIAWDAITGHDAGDLWEFTASAAADNYWVANTFGGAIVGYLNAAGELYSQVINCVGGGLFGGALNSSSISTGSLSAADITGTFLSIEGVSTSADLVTLTPYTTASSVVYTQGGAAAHDDMSYGGSFQYTGPVNIDYVVEIDGAGAPDTFQWSRDGGATWVATGVSVSTTEIELEDGVWVVWATSTGHEVGDKWEFTAEAFESVHENLETADGGMGYARVLQRVDTADATPKIVMSMPIEEDESLLLRVKINGLEDASPVTEWAGYDFEGYFYRPAAGNVTQLGVTSVIFENSSDVAIDCDFNLNITNQTVEVLVTGLAATDMKWKCLAEVVIV